MIYLHILIIEPPTFVSTLHVIFNNRQRDVTRGFDYHKSLGEVHKTQTSLLIIVMYFDFSFILMDIIIQHHFAATHP